MEDADSSEFSLNLDRGRRFGPVGQCIYCGKRDEVLTDEHIVPKALGGIIVLSGSSCRACANLTSKLELHVSRTVWGNLRMKFDFPSRNKSKRRSDAPVFSPDDTRIDVPIEDYPAIAPIVHLPFPWILIGNEEPAEFQFTVNFFQTDGPDSSAHGVDYYKIPGRLDPFQYMRFIAKIAHGMAVLRYGVDGFDPVLRNIIIEPEKCKQSEAFAYVGGVSEVVPPIESIGGSTHTFSAEWKDDASGQIWLCERVRLFANWKQPTRDGGFLVTPTYLVVVGRPKSSTPAPNIGLHYSAV